MFSEHHRIRIAKAFVAVAAGATGGACSYLAMAYNADWMLGGKPAYPTPLGFAQMAIFGAILGTPWGFVASSMCGLTLERSPQRKHYLLAIGTGIVFGAVGSVVCIPLHLPVDLRLR